MKINNILLTQDVNEEISSVSPGQKTIFMCFCNLRVMSAVTFFTQH